jgi:hypothetical protein
MTTSSTSLTTTAFSGAFAGAFFSDLDRTIGAFAFGTLALVFFVLYITDYFFFVSDFSRAGFDVYNSYAN